MCELNVAQVPSSGAVFKAKFLARARARHWCLPHCPGQVEFVDYSWRASENPVGQVHYIFQVYTFENVCTSFVVWYPSLS